ncbi:hypothetical protein O0L34_g839 [Tuta absoluta]|nr:hypothetical protein O0L34_g839 [Tuta absoluta]
MNPEPPLNPPENTRKSIQDNLIQEDIQNIINQRRSISVSSQYSIQSAQQNDTDVISSAEKAGGLEGLVEPAKYASSLTRATPQSNHILKKSSIVATSLPGIEINYGYSTNQDQSNKKDHTINEGVAPNQQNGQANDEVLVTPQPKEPSKNHGVCLKCGHYPKPERCKECGQSIIPAPKRCTGCGQILPETCSSCGQIVPSEWLWRERSDYNRSLDRHFGYGYYDKWSYENAQCRATTSRKLSKSSGDYDDSNGSHCSCNSTEYAPNVNAKPCVIADSATALHKSKWTTFKRYFRRVGRKARSTLHITFM